MTEDELRTADILEKMPSIFGRNEPVPDGLVGATILRIGTIRKSPLEGGGLIVDYQQPGSVEVRRIAFAFNELALWVEAECSLT